MSRSLFRAALARDEGPVLGTWVKLPATEVVELVALAGFDFIVIDLEHSPLDLESAFRHIGTARYAGLSPIVRVPGLEGGWVQRVLDAGAEGVMLPHVDTVQEAEDAVRAVRFPPLGSRGVGNTSRAGQWGAVPREEYLRFGREEVVLIAQVESALGAENASAIGSVEGLDALLVGAADLAVSVGGTESDADVQALIALAVQGARQAGVPIGNAGPATSAAVRASLEAGFTFTLMSNDASLFGAAASAAVEAGRTARSGLDVGRSGR